MMKRLMPVFLGMFACMSLVATTATGGDLRVQVVEPYMEVHTGPDRVYPITRVAEQDEWVAVHYRRTGWYRVRMQNGHEGWVSAQQMNKTRLDDGRLFGGQG